MYLWSSFLWMNMHHPRQKLRPELPFWHFYNVWIQLRLLNGNLKFRDLIRHSNIICIIQCERSNSPSLNLYMNSTRYPAGIWCQNDVVSTWMRRHLVASTLTRRHFHVICPLGTIWNVIITQQRHGISKVNTTVSSVLSTDRLCRC